MDYRAVYIGRTGSVVKASTAYKYITASKIITVITIYEKE